MVEAPEAPHHHHHNTGLPWFDFIVPIAVLCISVASLLTSLQSEKSMHALVEQNQRLVSAQSTPLLMLDSGNESGGKAVLTMTISNVGTGPAQVGWFHLTDSQGQDYSGGALTERIGKLDPHTEISSERIAASFLRAGDHRQVFTWPKPSTQPGLQQWQDLDQLRFHLNASACYCSLFDECKITHFADTHPTPVASCTAAR